LSNWHIAGCKRYSHPQAPQDAHKHVCPASHPIAARRARVGAAQAPLADLASEADARLPGCGGLARELRAARRAWAAAGGEASLGGADLRCVLPLADGRSWPWQVIPDSVMSWAAMLSCKCCCDVPMCLTRWKTRWHQARCLQIGHRMCVHPPRVEWEITSTGPMRAWCMACMCERAWRAAHAPPGVRWAARAAAAQGRTHVMGVLNVTPDSFSDGGRITSAASALAAGRALAAAGADILDIGGQSTRPGAARVGAEAEAARVVPVIRRAAGAELAGRQRLPAASAGAGRPSARAGMRCDAAPAHRSPRREARKVAVPYTNPIHVP